MLTSELRRLEVSRTLRSDHVLAFVRSVSADEAYPLQLAETEILVRGSVRGGGGGRANRTCSNAWRDSAAGAWPFGKDEHFCEMQTLLDSGESETVRARSAGTCRGISARAEPPLVSGDFNSHNCGDKNWHRGLQVCAG